MVKLLSFIKKRKNNVVFYKIDDNAKIEFNTKKNKWIKIIYKKGIIYKKCNLILEELNFDLIKNPDIRLGYFFLKSKNIKQHWTRIKLENNNLLFEVDPKFDITSFFPKLTKKFTLNYNNFYDAISKIKDLQTTIKFV